MLISFVLFAYFKYLLTSTDINCELFEVKAGDRVAIEFASTLSLDGTPDDGNYNPSNGPLLSDSYDYVMHGRVFSIKHVEGQKIEIMASFGGLLLKAVGEQAQFESLFVDMMFFILLRKSQ